MSSNNSLVLKEKKNLEEGVKKYILKKKGLLLPKKMFASIDFNIRSYDSLNFSIDPTIGYKLPYGFDISSGISSNIKYLVTQDRYTHKILSKSVLRYGHKALPPLKFVIDYYLKINNKESSINTTDFKKINETILLGLNLEVPLYKVINLNFSIKYNFNDTENDLTIKNGWNFNFNFSFFGMQL